MVASHAGVLNTSSPKNACVGGYDNGDVNENGKTAIGLDWKNNNFARASRFLVDFFAVTA